MNITVGGLMIASGIVVVTITIVATLFALFATGMSDNPQERFGWGPSLIGLAVGVALIVVAKLSGL